MRLALLGKPGAGKGTQGVRLARHFGVPLISTGELLRHRADAGGAAAGELAELLARGELVPDELVVSVVNEALAAASGAGWLRHRRLSPHAVPSAPRGGADPRRRRPPGRPGRRRALSSRRARRRRPGRRRPPRRHRATSPIVPRRDRTGPRALPPAGHPHDGRRHTASGAGHRGDPAGTARPRTEAVTQSRAAPPRGLGMYRSDPGATVTVVSVRTHRRVATG